MKSNTTRLSVGLVGFLQHKMADVCCPTATLVGFTEDPRKLDHRPDRAGDIRRDAQSAHRADGACDLVPDSRNPLLAPEVRAKIEAIEAEARAKGWPAELLWNGGQYWNLPAAWRLFSNRRMRSSSKSRPSTSRF